MKDGTCTVFRKTCVSQNGQSRASCKAVKYTEPAGAEEQPDGEETPVEEVVPPQT